MVGISIEESFVVQIFKGGLASVTNNDGDDVTDSNQSED